MNPEDLVQELAREVESLHARLLASQQEVSRLVQTLHAIATDSDCADTVRSAVESMMSTDAGAILLRTAPLR